MECVRDPSMTKQNIKDCKLNMLFKRKIENVTSGLLYFDFNLIWVVLILGLSMLPDYLHNRGFRTTPHRAVGRVGGMRWMRVHKGQKTRRPLQAQRVRDHSHVLLWHDASCVAAVGGYPIRRHRMWIRTEMYCEARRGSALPKRTALPEPWTIYIPSTTDT